MGSNDQGVNLLDYGIDQRSFNLVRGCGNVLGVLALSGLFGSVVELVIALCWFIPHIMVSEGVDSVSFSMPIVVAQCALLFPCNVGKTLMYSNGTTIRLTHRVRTCCLLWLPSHLLCSLRILFAAVGVLDHQQGKWSEAQLPILPGRSSSPPPFAWFCRCFDVVLP